MGKIPILLHTHGQVGGAELLTHFSCTGIFERRPQVCSSDVLSHYLVLFFVDWRLF